MYSHLQQVIKFVELNCLYTLDRRTQLASFSQPKETEHIFPVKTSMPTLHRVQKLNFVPHAVPVDLFDALRRISVTINRDT